MIVHLMNVFEVLSIILNGLYLHVDFFQGINNHTAMPLIVTRVTNIVITDIILSFVLESIWNLLCADFRNQPKRSSVSEYICSQFNFIFNDRSA